MDVTLKSGLGPGSKQGVEALIDYLYGAQRTSLRPADHTDANNAQLGFYSAAVPTGAMVSIGAGGILASLCWTDQSRLLVLLGIKAAFAVNAAITAATKLDVGAYVSRGGSAQATGGTAVVLTSNNNKMRSRMGTSLIASGEFRVASASAITRGTSGAVDANAFALSPFALKVSPDIGATAATGLALGVATPLVELYRWDPTKHPLILEPGNRETIELQHVAAGPVTGSYTGYFTFEWAELSSF